MFIARQVKTSTAVIIHTGIDAGIGPYLLVMASQPSSWYRGEDAEKCNVHHQKYHKNKQELPVLQSLRSGE